MKPRRSALPTPRETELLRAMAEGLTDREAAERMGVTVSTTRRMRDTLFARIGVNRRGAAVAWGMRMGIVS